MSLLALACQGERDCKYVEPTCAEDAEPDWIATSFEAFETFSTFDNAACPGQVVVELDASGITQDDAYLFRMFAPDELDEEGDCAASRLHVTVLRRISGSWETFDDYVVEGHWTGQVCNSKGAGKLGPNEANAHVAYPFSWIDLRGAERVRVVLSGEVDCATRTIQVGFPEKI